MADITESDDVTIELATVLDKFSAINYQPKIKFKKTFPGLDQATFSSSSVISNIDNNEPYTIDPAVLDKIAGFSCNVTPHKTYKEVSTKDFEKLTDLRQFYPKYSESRLSQDFISEKKLSERCSKSSEVERIFNNISNSGVIISPKNTEIESTQKQDSGNEKQEKVAFDTEDKNEKANSFLSFSYKESKNIEDEHVYEDAEEKNIVLDVLDDGKIESFLLLSQEKIMNIEQKGICEEEDCKNVEVEEKNGDTGEEDEKSEPRQSPAYSNSVRNTEEIIYEDGEYKTKMFDTKEDDEKMQSFISPSLAGSKNNKEAKYIPHGEDEHANSYEIPVYDALKVPDSFAPIVSKKNHSRLSQDPKELSSFMKNLIRKALLTAKKVMFFNVSKN